MTAIDKNNILKQVLEDPIFTRNEKCSKLLIYLAECSKKHYVPSESEIAAHIFGQNRDFDPTIDASVRVLIWKLRKKLDEYYKSKGKHDKVRLAIPKRQYSLELMERPNKNKFLKQLLPFVSLVVIIALSISLLWLYIQYREIRKIIPEIPPIKKNLIFRDFVDNRKPTTIVIGHIFTYCEFQDEINSFRIIRNRLINSDADLSKYMSQYNIPSKNIWKPTWDIVPENTLKYFSLIQSIYPLASRPLMTLKLSSKIEWSDLLDHQIIYVGHFHNLGKLDQFYQSKHFYSPSQITDYSELISKLAENKKINIPSEKNLVETADDNQINALFSIYHQNMQNDSIEDVYKFIYNDDTKYVQDYVILIKLPGPNFNKMLFIISFHQIGRLKIIEVLADPIQMRKFENEFRTLMPSMPTYFEMLIEVKGYKETAMNMKILHIYPAGSQFELNNVEMNP
ncbi:MAG: helix-turn-helix domain-containing protein [bacterium]|nr:MAG: helix-turn-helix domain-containing protein [bacterium]